jgi:hypothetical protein
MLKNAVTLAATITAALLPAAAIAQQERQFTHEGETYVYTVTPDKDTQVIEGHRLPAGDAFRLIVRGKWVAGYANGVPVSFRLRDAKGAYQKVALTAAR